MMRTGTDIDGLKANVSRLVLGTAQLGLPYGLANTSRRVDSALATAIVREAWKHGIREFDTAQDYGESEYFLGKALSRMDALSEARITTKLFPALDHLDPKTLSEALNQSLQVLGVSKLYGLLLHREEKLTLWDHGLAQILRSFVASEKVERIGMSVYSPEKAIQALNTEGLDIVQLPANILDRRFEKAGVFALARNKKKDIYIRSVFLQGLILMDAEDVPSKMAFALPLLEKWRAFCKNQSLSPKKMALGYVKAEMPEAKVIVGADTPMHIKENCRLWEDDLPPALIPQIKKIFDAVDENILNPTLWPK